MSFNCTCLEDIETGDLMIFSDEGTTGLSRFLLFVVRFFTRSEYGHVGIAVKVEDKLFVFDATIPTVRLRPVHRGENFYFIHMRTEVDVLKVTHKYLGIKYSILDALRAYLGMTVKKNNRYQCVELAREVYTNADIVLPKFKLTPSAFVRTLLSMGPYYLRRHEGETK